MKTDKIITVVKTYIKQQLSALDSPIINFIKPVITRIVDNNIDKISSFLDLLKDNNNEVDIKGLLTDMTKSLVDSKSFNYGIFNIGEGKISMSILNQKITFTKNDIDLLKVMFEENNYEQIS